MKRSFLIYCLLISGLLTMLPFTLCAQGGIASEEPSILPKEQTVYLRK